MCHYKLIKKVNSSYIINYRVLCTQEAICAEDIRLPRVGTQFTLLEVINKERRHSSSPLLGRACIIAGGLTAKLPYS